jgi:hypothetical protein
MIAIFFYFIWLVPPLQGFVDVGQHMGVAPTENAATECEPAAVNRTATAMILRIFCMGVAPCIFNCLGGFEI